MKNRGRRSPRYTGPKMKPTTAATRLPFYEVVYGFFNLCVVHVWLFAILYFVDLTAWTCTCLLEAWSKALCWSYSWWDYWFMAHSPKGWQTARKLPQGFINNICHPRWAWSWTDSTPCSHPCSPAQSWWLWKKWWDLWCNRGEGEGITAEAWFG